MTGCKLIWNEDGCTVAGSPATLMSTLASIFSWSHCHRMAHQSPSPDSVTRCYFSSVGEKAHDRNSLHWMGRLSISGSGSVFFFLLLAISKMVT